MSIWSNLNTGSSGIIANGKAIGIVGDNIANVSTTGFKGSRAGFADVLGGAAANNSRLGAGVRVDGAQLQYGQGSLQQTGNSFDMAIRGNGFFVLDGASGGQAGEYFTRDGRFSLDKSGYVVNPAGLRLQGYPIATDGTVGSSVGDLALGAGQASPNPTTEMNMSLNLDAQGAVGPAFDPTDPQGTSDYATSATVYDSLGTAHRVDLYFRKSGVGGWEWRGMVDGGELNGGTAGVQTEIASGTLSFTTSGELNTETLVSSSADFVGAAAAQSIAFDFGDAIADGGTGLLGTTQFASPSTVNSLDQDGYATGSLVDVSIGDDGTIEGVFSNGQRRSVARVALATFPGQNGLERAGNSLFVATNRSGEALIDAAATGARGSISAGSLEASNVDLSSELVNLISFQRAFQASVRTVTTADEMLAEVASIKR